MVALVLALAVVGAVLEVAGIALALWEVHDRRREVKTYEAHRVVVHASAALRFGVGLSATATVEGDPLTLEQRVTGLEAEAHALRGEMLAAEARVRMAANLYAEGLVRSAQADSREDVEGVRRLLLLVSRPNSRAWWSLGLTASGLALQTATSVVGAL